MKKIFIFFQIFLDQIFFFQGLSHSFLIFFPFSLE